MNFLKQYLFESPLPDFKYLDSFESGNNSPAQVSRSSGIVEINMSEYERLTDFEKEWVILHELGHYYLDTSDEIAADNWALDKIALTRKYSLRDTTRAVAKIAIAKERWNNASIEALKIAAENGSQEAQRLLGILPEKQKSVKREKQKSKKSKRLYVLLIIIILILIWTKKH